MKEFKAAVRYQQYELLVAYLEGKTIEFSRKDSDNWGTVIPYYSPVDVIRLSNKDFKFRIKPENT